MTFYFSDNYDTPVNVTGLTSSEIQMVYARPPGCTSCLPVPSYYWLDSYESYTVNPPEAVTVTSGGMSGSAGSSFNRIAYCSATMILAG